MSQKCCSKVDFVTVFQNHRTFRIFKKKIGKLLVAKLTKQEFKHAESTTRSRSCRKLVRFTILNRKFYNLQSPQIFLGCLCLFSYSKLLVGTRLPGKPDTVAINSCRAQFVSTWHSCPRPRLEKLLRSSRTLQTSHARHKPILDRLSSCFSCY